MTEDEARAKLVATADATAPGPYTARSASDRTDDWHAWYVTNDGRRNVMRWPGGAVLTDKETAIAIAALWNAKGAR